MSLRGTAIRQALNTCTREARALGVDLLVEVRDAGNADASELIVWRLSPYACARLVVPYAEPQCAVWSLEASRYTDALTAEIVRHVRRDVLAPVREQRIATRSGGRLRIGRRLARGGEMPRRVVAC